MVTLLFVFLGWLSEQPYWVFVALILAAVFWEVNLRWKMHFRPDDPYQQQLTKASHGAAFIILTPLFAKMAYRQGWTHYLPSEWLPFVWPAVFIVMGLGLYWLIFGAARTRGQRRRST